MKFPGILSRCFRRLCCALLMASMWPLAAAASEAGGRQYTVPASSSNPSAIPVLLYYPTQAQPRTINMGPWPVRVAMEAAPDAKVKGLIVISHGMRGGEMVHSSLAEALARAGYLVAALRHPGDNWQDASLKTQEPPSAYFTERPKQVSRVIDALLNDAEWKDRIAADAHGPRIGAVGHSAGGYTVLALAGGQVDLSRMDAHCKTHRTDDQVFCGMGRANQPSPAAPVLLLPSAIDPRVRAVVAMAPLSLVFTASSLADIKIPVAVYAGTLDRFLQPQFHAEWVAKNVPHAELHLIPNAGHYAFMDRPSFSIQMLDGDAAADSPDFDRKTFLTQLGTELPVFFDKAFFQ